MKKKTAFVQKRQEKKNARTKTQEQRGKIMERRQRRTGIVMAALAVLLLCVMFLTMDTADAAVKYQRASVNDVRDVNALGESELEMIEEAPTGGYFLTDRDYEKKKSYLYYAATLDGKKVRLATGSFYEEFCNADGKILTNGSKIYFSLEEQGSSGETHKGRIYCGSVDGSKPKLLKTVSLDGIDAISLLGIYNGNLYFQKIDMHYAYSNKTPLYRLNLKSKEVKRVSANFNATNTVYAYVYASGSSRYLYGYSLGKDGIRIFDCKTNKIIRTLTNGNKPVVDGGKLYYAVNSSEKNYTRIYRASLSGANRELLFEIPRSYALVDYIGADVICYSAWEVEGVEEGYHVYTVATGEDKVVDLEHAKEEGYKTMEWHP